MFRFQSNVAELTPNTEFTAVPEISNDKPPRTKIIRNHSVSNSTIMVAAGISAAAAAIIFGIWSLGVFLPIKAALYFLTIPEALNLVKPQMSLAALILLTSAVITGITT